MLIDCSYNVTRWPGSTIIRGGYCRWRAKRHAPWGAALRERTLRFHRSKWGAALAEPCRELKRETPPEGSLRSVSAPLVRRRDVRRSAPGHPHRVRAGKEARCRRRGDPLCRGASGTEECVWRSMLVPQPLSGPALHYLRGRSGAAGTAVVEIEDCSGVGAGSAARAVYPQIAKAAAAIVVMIQARLASVDIGGLDRRRGAAAVVSGAAERRGRAARVQS